MEIKCRACGSQELFSALDLGFQPVANFLLDSPHESFKKFPLNLRICSDCSLGQIEDYLTSEEIFSDYRYFSSVSKTFVNHAAQFTEKIKNLQFLEPNDYVLEIASNDGYLLQHFMKLGVRCLGVEPAKNVAEIARERSVPTIDEFFTSTLAKEIMFEFGSPKLLVANNVLAHVPNINDFIEGLSLLMSSESILTIENPPLTNILLHNQFDSIYHEHYSYLTATSVSAMMRRHGLILIAVENIQTHGGSHRYWIMKHEKNLSFPIHSNAEDFVLEEKKWQISNIESWQKTNSKMANVLDTHSKFLEECAINGLQVIGVGAAAKTTMFMNLLPGINLPKCVVDSSLEKQGRFIPGTTAQIVSLDSIEFNIANIFMIYAWNVEEELRKLIMQKFQSRSRIFRNLPELKEI